MTDMTEPVQFSLAKLGSLSRLVSFWLSNRAPNPTSRSASLQAGLNEHNWFIALTLHGVLVLFFSYDLFSCLYLHVTNSIFADVHIHTHSQYAQDKWKFKTMYRIVIRNSIEIYWVLCTCQHSFEGLFVLSALLRPTNFRYHRLKLWFRHRSWELCPFFNFLFPLA